MNRNESPNNTGGGSSGAGSSALAPPGTHAGAQAGGAPGGLDTAWQAERETVGRPFWALPLVLSVWAIAVPLGMSLWFDDEAGLVAAGPVAAGPVAAGNPQAGQLRDARLQGGSEAGIGGRSCEALALQLAEMVRMRDPVAAAHAGHALGRQGCLQGAAPAEAF